MNGTGGFDIYSLSAGSPGFFAASGVRAEPGMRLSRCACVRCVTDGTLSIATGGVCGTAPKGSVVVTRAFEPYTIFGDDATVSELMLGEEYFADFAREYPGRGLVNFPPSDAFGRLVEVIAAAEKAGDELERHAYADLALSALVVGGGTDERSAFGTPAAAVVGFVCAHSAERLDLAAVAAGTGLSTATVSRVFSSRVGMDFRVFLGAVRAMKAHEALASEENAHAPVSEIAKKCGFSGAASFYRSYNRLFGAPPRRG